MIRIVVVQVLCWASCQPYLLAALLSLTCVGMRQPPPLSTRGQGADGCIVSTLFFTLAVFSKAAALPLVALLLLFDALSLLRQALERETGGSSGAEAKPLGMGDACLLLARRTVVPLCVALLGAAAAAHSNPAGQTGAHELGLGQKLLRATHAPWFYLAKTVVRLSLSSQNSHSHHTCWLGA